MVRHFLTSLSVAALSVALAGPVAAQSVSGAYLAGRHAAVQSDFAAAAEYYGRALARDPQNVELMESAALSNLSLGTLDRAIPIARALSETNQTSQVAHMLMTADLVNVGHYEELLARETQSTGIGPLVDGLVKAWAHLGTGDLTQSLVAFDEMAEQPGIGGLVLYHKALALASVEDYEGAVAIFGTDKAGGAGQTRRGVLAHAEILAQLDRREDAIRLVQTSFGGATDPELDAFIAALQSDAEVPFTQVTTPKEGIAEVFFTFAIKELKKVSADDPAYHAAELGRAGAMRRADRPEQAIEVLEQLARSHGDLAVVHSTLGDTLRGQDDFAGAIAAYDRALPLLEEDNPSRWLLYYSRGIAAERSGDWEASERDFRAALEIRPDQPQVLNYLGYSMVEQNRNLDEALGMIERAVAAEPTSGYIVDSLGWVLYRLGRYDEAVVHMEKAVQLLAVDPVVNDHLGDVYWAVGRYREAEFQWSRALSFIDKNHSEPGTDTEADPDRIRRKLEVGLDVVLQEEGAPPLKTGDDI